MKRTNVFFGTALILAGVVPGALPQAAAGRAGTTSIKTFYLANVSQANDAKDLTTALRNLLDPSVKIYLVAAQNAIVIDADPDQLVRAQKLINDLDRPKKSYRLIFTTTEVEGGKRVGTQHFSIIVVAGGRTTLKQGSKVPIVTGGYESGISGPKTTLTYLDVGLNVDASLDESVDGLTLRSKVEQSGLADEKSTLGTQDPIIRQTVLEGVSILPLGRPVMLGSLDIPGTTRRMDIEVVLEAVK